MTIGALLCELWESGIQPRLTPDQQNLLLPAQKLTDLQRQALKEQKAEVLEMLLDPLSRELMATAMKVCDYWNDSPAARMEMRMDIWNTPANERRELLELFQREYKIGAAYE